MAATDFASQISSLAPADPSVFAPRPFSDFGNVPTIDPAQAQAAKANAASADFTQVGGGGAMRANRIDYTQLPGAVQSFAQMLKDSMTPQFQDQSNALDADLASRGIFTSGAGAQLHNDLAGRESAALASGMSPLVQAGFNAWQADQAQNSAQAQEAERTTYQGDLQRNIEQAQLNQLTGSQNAANQQQTALANAGHEQQVNLANMDALNTAMGFNVDNYLKTIFTDQKQYNDFMAQLQSLDAAQQAALIQDLVGTYGAPSSVLSQGLANSGSAYSNAYNNAQAGAAGVGATFADMVKQWTNRTHNGGGAPAIPWDKGVNGLDT